MTGNDVFSTSVVLFGLGCMVLGGERLVLLRRRSPWALFNGAFATRKARFVNVEAFFQAKLLVQAAKVFGGACCLTCVLLLPMWAALPLVATAIVLIVDRSLEYVGGDGADQQLRIVGVALALTALARPFDANAEKACVGFLACELALCYGVAGWCKLCNAEWRRGDAVRCIAAARAYGEGRFSPWLNRSSWMARAVSWGVIGFEMTFPLFLLSGRLAAVGLALAFLFHLAIAIGMKLNSFLWVFPISFPAFYAAAEWIYAAWLGR